MNLVLRATRPNGLNSSTQANPVNEFTGDWYVVSVRKLTNMWAVRGKILNAAGGLTLICDERLFPSLESAKDACRKQVKRKKTMRKYVDANITDLPQAALVHLEPDSDSFVSAEEMVKMIKEAKQERYVWFKDVSGLEEYFRLGLEYLAYLTEDQNIYTVIDEFGMRRDCLDSRFEKIEDTERTHAVMGNPRKLML